MQLLEEEKTISITEKECDNQVDFLKVSMISLLFMNVAFTLRFEGYMYRS
jgi:hypothetical protein